MTDYFTLDTVRNELLRVGVLKITFDGGTFPQNWQYCPCIIVKNCTRLNNKICSQPIYVGVFIRTPNISMAIVVELIYERKTHRGFIRADNMKLNALINNNVINGGALKIVSMPF